MEAYLKSLSCVAFLHLPQVDWSQRRAFSGIRHRRKILMLLPGWLRMGIGLHPTGQWRGFHRYGP